MRNPEAWIGPAVGVVVLGMFLWRNIRFLLQGRQYRQLSLSEQEQVQKSDADWEAYHGRQLPLPQLIVGVCVAAAVLGYLVWQSLSIQGE